MFVSDEYLGSRCGDWHKLDKDGRYPELLRAVGANVIIWMWSADLEIGDCQRKELEVKIGHVLAGERKGRFLKSPSPFSPLHKRL